MNLIDLQNYMKEGSLRIFNSTVMLDSKIPDSKVEVNKIKNLKTLPGIISKSGNCKAYCICSVSTACHLQYYNCLFYDRFFCYLKCYFLNCGHGTYAVDHTTVHRNFFADCIVMHLVLRKFLST